MTGLSKAELDTVTACMDLIGRAGARSFTFGYLHDDVPTEEAAWWAHAQYQGTRITVEGHRGPVEACEALARRILTGAKCRCGRLVAMSTQGAAFFPDARMADGTRFTAVEARAGQYLWSRHGDKWEPSCPVPAGRRMGPL